MAPKKQMSHAEMWDDSALVDSWNDALEEYKKYHSIEARGENVEEVLNGASNPPALRGNEMDYEDGEVQDHDPHPHPDPRAKNNVSEKQADHDTMTVEEHVQAQTTQTQEEPHAANSVPATEKATAKDQASVRSPALPASSTNGGGPPALPQQLIGQVHDEGLKNLLMSWYYAGYYTGLFEGRQEAEAKTKTSSSAKHEA